MRTVTTLEQARLKMQMGDYDQVGRMIGTTRDGAKMRLIRKDAGAIAALLALVNGREKLIEDYIAEMKH